MNKVFVDINVIQCVPPSCVNRDDTGSPKTAMYGGVKRSRISSQSWKKAMRDYFRENFNENDLAMRSTKIVSMISDEIVKKDESISIEKAEEMAVKILDVAGVKTKSKKKGQVPETSALFFMSKKQAENMAELALNNCTDRKEIATALMKDKGIEISLFGRMVADEASYNVDAAAQVAHSISTHRIENEYDYFTAIDDYSVNEQGAGMIGIVEYNSSTLYRYSTVAAHVLKSNLCENDAVAKAIGAFVHAFIISMPTGKQNTFANRTVPYSVLIAVREDQPVNLIGAFESPVYPDKNGGGYNAGSVKKMVEYKNETELSFVSKPIKTWQIGQGLESIGPSTDLNTAIIELEKYLSDKEY